MCIMDIYLFLKNLTFHGEPKLYLGGSCVSNSTVLIPAVPVDNKLSYGFQGHKAS